MHLFVHNKLLTKHTVIEKFVQVFLKIGSCDCTLRCVVRNVICEPG